ncbi:alpha/beta fold hydrolase [Humitalea sp. 24SJ18S-53]|uniref:alpha/beta fold hydrolase n=1 Tax=Humitalea sp. 24SJ18S-53 TaxID=3422307 RepID=UPI003D664975
MRLVRYHAGDGLPLAARDWAGPEDRTPLLCLPGLSRTSLDFARLAARHGGTRRVVALDYAGHGESGRSQDLGRYSAEHALRDVLDSCAALGLHRAVAVGTSFGGLLSMIIPVLRATLLRGVVLNDIGPALEAPGLDDVRDFVGTDPALADLDAATAHVRRHMPPLGLDDAGWRDMAGLTYAQGEDGRLHPRWDIRLAEAASGGPPPDLWRFWQGSAQLPTLLVWGEESRLLSAATVARMRREKPDLRVVSVPGVGHAPPLSGAAVDPVLDDFLDGIA